MRIPPLPLTLRLLPLLLLGSMATGQEAQDPLRVFLRCGPKTHGPGQHDHPRFLAEWSELLGERGAAVEGALRFPTAEELERADVLVMYAAEAATIRGDERERFDAFLERGGGLVVVHDGVCGEEPAYFAERAGGAWEHGVARYMEGEIGLYMAAEDHPITRGIPHFDLVDEIYHELHLSPRARVLASAFHDVFSITPQMWVVDDGPYRAFVTLQGHEHATFSHPAFRALLLRGIAWAGRRDADLFLEERELAGLRYPPGGPLAPEVAHEALVLHEDFELSLVAAEPLVVNPISLDWDDEGRLWVACTPGYPYKQESSGIPAHDEILVLEDTDGDGRMDASRVFADGLDLVTSFVFHGDGVIATAAPDILWLRDTDGDGVCDRREVLYTGFGYGDTHATTSNLRWGPDGWIHGTQGYSGGASRDIRSPYLDGRLGRESVSYGHVPNGLFRFRPDGSAIETVSAYGSNTWGLDFRPDGELFFTMANGSHLRHVIAPEAALSTARLGGARSWRDIVDHREVHRISEATRSPYVQIDFVGGFTAAAGSTIYSAGAWPEEFEGNHFVCEPTVNLVHRDLLTEDGVSFRAVKPRKEEFLASTDPWFRPVHTRTGPDGALYVLDFYNQAAVHNDTRGPKHGPTNAAVRPDRDRHHGRIWRVAHRASRTVDPEDDFQTALRRDRRWLEAGDPRSATVDTTTPARHVRTLWRAAQYLGADARVAEAARRALTDADPGVRRAGALVAAELGDIDAPLLDEGLLAALADDSARVRLAALRALAVRPVGVQPDPRLVAAWERHGDDVSRSVHLAVVSRAPELHLRAALAGGGAASLIAESLRVAARGADAGRAGSLLAALAETPPADLAGALNALEGALPDGLRLPPGQASRALVTLFDLGLERPAAARELLPLASRLEDASALGDALEVLAARSLALVEDPDAPLPSRLDALASLLAVPASRARAAQAAGIFLDPYFDLDTQRRVVEELASTACGPGDAALVRAFPGLSNAARDAIFAAVIARPAGAMALLDAVEEEEIQVTELGPNRIHRLRNHPDPAVAARAEAVVSTRLGSETAAVESWIEENLPALLASGDAQRGAEVFRANCAVCHSTDLLDGDEGHVGPALDGMGAHGREHLLPFILRPNLSVEAAYLEYVAETVDGTFASGVLVSDAPDAITLAGSGGEVRVRRDELASLRSTGRSPMPTGFESLGAEALRDLLTFLCQGYEDYRILPLADRMSSTTRALYDATRDAKEMRFRRFGVVEVEGVPYEIVDPDRSPSGCNALVLKGGAAADWDSKLKMPQRVEVPVGGPVLRMHVLGGIAAWGHPFFGTGEDLVRWTWVYADGVEETVVLRDGHEFADWIGRHDVPGSEFVEDLLAPGSWGQVRRFHLDPGRPSVSVERVVLESFDNRMAPTFLALTAQVGGELAVSAATEPGAARVLVVGGGSSHDFRRWFDEALVETLEGTPGLSAGEVAYTDRVWEIAPQLEHLEVLVLACNQPLADPELRRALFAFVEDGGGLLVLHASSWFNWSDWPEYNRELVGGGSRSHAPYGEFEVRLEVTDHPLTDGLPGTFRLRDELYRFEPLPDGAPLRPLATGSAGADAYPVVLVREGAAGRVVVITLGHDGEAHGHPAFRRLMRNAASWLSDAAPR